MTKLTGSLGVRNEINVDIIGTGARGKEGKSAYEIWLDLGNEGTEQEYLASLKGQDGDTPVKGVDYFDGAQGPKGDKGDAATVSVGAVTTGEAGTDASVENVGTSSAAVFNFVIPRGDKGERGEQGIPGPQGEPGSDADVTAENIQSALGYTPAKPKGVYELIETITLTENTTSVIRTQEPDGTPYAFKAIGVVVQAEVGSVNSGITVLGNYESTRLQATFINGAISNTIKKYGYAQIYPDWGVWTAIGSTAVNGFSWTVTQMTGYSPAQAFSVKESENPYCTQVTLVVNTSGATIPTGTIIQIYGVRA